MSHTATTAPPTKTAIKKKAPAKKARTITSPVDFETRFAELAAVLDFDDTDVDHLEWRADALCGGTDPDQFYPEKGKSTRKAKLICSGCRVRVDCLTYALKHIERFGIWGGLSERERRKLFKLPEGGVPAIDRHLEEEVDRLTKKGKSAREIGAIIAVHERTVVRIRRRLRERAEAEAAKAAARQPIDQPIVAHAA